jgi:hypothetical protein
MKTVAVRELRQAIRRIQRQRNPKRRRYGPEIQRSSIQHALIQRSRGTSVGSTAAALGLPYRTLWLWLRGQPAGFRAVATTPVESSTLAPDLRLVTAQGHRVEGLSRDDLIILLRALS